MSANFAAGALAGVILCTTLGLAFAIGHDYAVARADKGETIVCHAGTEEPINRPTEYPAWQLECDSPHHRVVVVD